jgi:hypothetical protein
MYTFKVQRPIKLKQSVQSSMGAIDNLWDIDLLVKSLFLMILIAISLFITSVFTCYCVLLYILTIF